MKDVMLDLETLGTSKSAGVIQIGACYFDIRTGEIGETFKSNVDWKSVKNSGGEFDEGAIEFWISQSEGARASILADPKPDITIVLSNFNEFIKDAKKIWSHATFDFVILSETFRRLGMKPNFTHRSPRDLRTLVDLGGITINKRKREGIHHDALDDCKFQVKYAVEAFNNVKRVKNRC